MLEKIKFQVQAPTILDFLFHFLKEVLGIVVEEKTREESKKKEQKMLQAVLLAKQSPQSPQLFSEQAIENFLIQKMSVYLAKMIVHDSSLSCLKPSLLAIGSIYVALKICELLKRKELTTAATIKNLITKSQMPEPEILAVSQQVLHLAQNFDKAFPQLDHLKISHFKLIT